jgi:RNA polymerase sigma-70 factor, ECF subfamily
MTSEGTKAHITSGDPAEFASLVEPYRQELHLHCYRLLGSLHDAEDMVQETMLRAWQHGDAFKGQSSLRTWLYKIATNACLDVLKKRPARTLPVAATSEADPLLPFAPAWSRSSWLEPFPDSWLSQEAEDPAARYSRRESVSFAFLIVVQLLPPRQRAILLLSDVLDWHASEIAELLSLSVSAVNSALHRARVRLSKHYHTPEREGGADLHADAATKTLLERYLHAWESEDIEGLVALMKEDATFGMPPLPSWYRGRDAIRVLLTQRIFAGETQKRWSFSPTGANGCPAFAMYRAVGSGGPSRAFGIQVLTLEATTSGLLIADSTTFLDPLFFPSFGFPQELPM